MKTREKTYTTKKVAEIVGVHKNTLLNWIKSGKVQDVNKDWKDYRIWKDEDVERVKEYKSSYRQMKFEQMP